ncbi:hypothetical protein [Acinetobacter pittii]|uniref:hypothetical protein n=1 Tax=Acinetobacter pittii TaxID=48296 RepID=UPI003AA98A0F
MATNWNAVLANINNASDILAILRKVSGLLDGKVDLTRIDEIISDIENMQTNVETALNNVTSALSEFDTHSQEAIEQVIAAGLMEGFNTEAELLATRPTVAKKYAKAEDTDIIWFWNKPAGAPDGSYWTSTGQSELSRAKAYTDNLRDRVFFNAINTDFNISGFINSTGQLAPSTFFKSTDYLKVIENTPYRILSQVTGAANYAWFTKDKVFISAFGTDQTTLVEKTYTSPPNAAFVRLCAYNTAAQAVAYMRADVYKIDQIKKILEQHTPNLSSKFSLYGAANVSDTLDAILAKQSIIIANQNLGLNQLDIINDESCPYFVNTSQYVRSVGTPANFNAVNILSRVSDTQMTVSDASAFSQNVSFVVYDNIANKYTSHSTLAINGTTITVYPDLPANPYQAQTMHDSYEGQHLSLFGYRGLADFIVDSIQKYSYKKSDNLIFNFNPSKYVKQKNSQGQITSDGSDVKIQVFYIGTAKTGGLISGTNLAKICDLSDELNIGDGANTQYLSKSYILKDSIAGNGYEINFDAKASDGFVKIPLAVRNEVYTSSADNQTYRTSGRVRLQVLNGATVIHDAVYAAGQVHHIDVDFTAADNIKIRVTCETSVPTSSFLSGIFAYRKSPKTSKDRIFQAGDVIAFLGDSWTQYPKAPNNLGAIRPDGSQSDGIQELSVRMKNRLDVLGIPSTMLNMGFGGQTSRWGKYWMHKIAQLNPKPNFCVINFGINDLNSVANPSNNFYDFDPVNMFLNKPETSGGINGKISSHAEWEQNLISICNYMISKGIKPIVLMPTQTASVSQSQGARLYQLNRIASGFNPLPIT